MIIPPRHVIIDRKVGAFQMKGTADLKETKISGLSHLRRVGDSFLKTDNGSIVANLHLGAKNVKLYSDITLHFLYNTFHPNMKVEVGIGNLGELES